MKVRWAVKAEVESEAEGLELQSSAFLPHISVAPLLTFYIWASMESLILKRFLLIKKNDLNLKCAFYSTQKCNF